MNEYNFKQFVLAIKDAGFISKKLITSDITLDFAYTLYLRLLKDSSIDKTKVKNYVQRWYVMSTLTGRYISSPIKSQRTSRLSKILNSWQSKLLLQETLVYICQSSFVHQNLFYR